MILDKIAIDKENQKIHEYYYNSAREAMFDLFNNMKKENLINTLFLPGYIGGHLKKEAGYLIQLIN